MAERKAFVRALFQGRFDNEAIFPFPHPDAETHETTEEIVSMVRAWAQDAIDPAAIDRAETVPPEVVAGLRELGLFGLTTPEEHGGAGCGHYTYSRVMEVVGGRCPSSVTFLGSHLGIGMRGLLMYGTPEQKARWLPRLATGELMACLALTEPEAGSDAAALRMRADRLPDGSWKLNGRKIWITCGATASLFTVLARTPRPDDPDAPLMQRPISAFIVTNDIPGVEQGLPEKKLGLRGSNTADIHFEDVVIPADYLLGPEGGGFKVALNVLNSGRHALAAVSAGQAKVARDLALAHARERVQYGRPIAEFGMVQQFLAGIESDIYAMDAVTLLTACLADSGEHETMLEAACCKIFATEALWNVSNDALQIAGGSGVMSEYPFERIVRDARVNTIFEGTNQILRWMMGGEGLRTLAKRPEEVTTSLDAVHPSFAEERALIEGSLPRFHDQARRVLETHGKKVGEAQLPLRRLAEAATALYVSCAVLSYASSKLERAEVADPEQEIRVAKLAVRRQALILDCLWAEEAAAIDELFAGVSSGMR